MTREPTPLGLLCETGGGHRLGERSRKWNSPSARASLVRFSSPSSWPTSTSRPRTSAGSPSSPSGRPVHSPAASLSRTCSSTFFRSWLPGNEAVGELLRDVVPLTPLLDLSIFVVALTGLHSLLRSGTSGPALRCPRRQADRPSLRGPSGLVLHLQRPHHLHHGAPPAHRRGVRGALCRSHGVALRADRQGLGGALRGPVRQPHIAPSPKWVTQFSCRRSWSVLGSMGRTLAAKFAGAKLSPRPVSGISSTVWNAVITPVPPTPAMTPRMIDAASELLSGSRPSPPCDDIGEGTEPVASSTEITAVLAHSEHANSRCFVAVASDQPGSGILVVGGLTLNGRVDDVVFVA